MQLHALTLHVAAVQHEMLEDFAGEGMTCRLTSGPVTQKAVADI